MRKRIIRRIRKNIIRLGGKILKVEVINSDDDGVKWPRKEWDYGIDIKINGYTCTCAEGSLYEAWKAALEIAEWAASEPPFVKEEFEKRYKGDTECLDATLN